MSVLPNVGIHFPSHGSKIKRLTSYDTSLGVQWMALTCRATFSGPYGLRIIPFSVLMLFDNDTEPLLTPGFWILPTKCSL